nr:MAG TPA: hypothetical protein [Caudoviricetes sp.]
MQFMQINTHLVYLPVMLLYLLNLQLCVQI